MKVLITSAATAAAYQLKSKLGQKSVILGDYAELPAVMLSNGSMVNLPVPADVAYMHKMLSLCLDAGITHIYALQPAEWQLLQAAGQLFEEYGIKILSADDEVS